MSRRQRVAAELFPWAPAIAGTLGFGIGLAVLAVDVSRWFLVLLIVPVILYRSLFSLLLDLAASAGRPVELVVEAGRLEVRSGRSISSLPLEGIIQVFASGPAWTVLHMDGTVLTVPADAISDEQVEYLKSFARTAAAERKAAEADR
jgi:hypothetical protein